MNIPYVGQVGAGANQHYNDCGAAAADGIVGWAGLPMPTVDDLYNEVRPFGDSYLQVADVMRLLFTRGIDCDWDAGVSTDRLVALVQKAPCIALIDYDELEAIRPNKFDGSHFVTVIGGDDKYIYIHDPLNTPTSGENIKVSRAMWDRAWTNLDDKNPDRGLIIVNSVTEMRTGTVLPAGDGLANRSRPYTNKTDSQVARVRFPAGANIQIASIEAIWGKTVDGRFIAIKYDGVYLVDAGIDL